MGKFVGFHPFDWEGRLLSAEESFKGAQNDEPLTLYLAPPQQKIKLFPIDEL